MTVSDGRKTGSKNGAYRARRPGSRPIQFGAPGVYAPGFRLEAHRQSLAVAASPHADDDQAFVDAISDWGASPRAARNI